MYAGVIVIQGLSYERAITATPASTDSPVDFPPSEIEDGRNVPTHERLGHVERIVQLPVAVDIKESDAISNTRCVN